MKILLMRHGEAESRAPSDEKRRLTARGESEVLSCASEAFANRLVPPTMIEQIIASPYVRAQQTAVLLQGLFTPLVPIETWSEIVPSGNGEVVLNRLRKLEVEELILVTHQPFVSNFIFYLTGTDVRMSTASIALLQMDVMVAGCGEVECVLHSKSW